MLGVDMSRAPVIDRETIEMLREMDEVTTDSNLLLELIDDFLAYSADLVTHIQNNALQEAQSELAATSHSLKGASLNIGALVLFKVCDKIELLARKQELTKAKAQLSDLSSAFHATTNALIELRERTLRGEVIEDLLSEDLLA